MQIARVLFHTSRAITVLLLAGCATGGVLEVSFVAPSTNTDGSPLTDLTTYRIYYGTSDSPCRGQRAIVATVPKVPLPADQRLTVKLTGLTVGQLYFVAVSAMNSRGIESECTKALSARARRP